MEPTDPAQSAHDVDPRAWLADVLARLPDNLAYALGLEGAPGSLGKRYATAVAA